MNSDCVEGKKIILNSLKFYTLLVRAKHGWPSRDALKEIKKRCLELPDGGGDSFGSDFKRPIRMPRVIPRSIYRLAFKQPSREMIAEKNTLLPLSHIQEFLIELCTSQ